MAMAYGNNLVFVVCFSLTCMGMVLAKHINQTIENVQIVSADIKIGFAEPHQYISVLITNKSQEPLEDLIISTREKNSIIVKTRLNPFESQLVEYPWSIPKRGYQKIPTIIVSSEFPSGLFHAWKVLKSDKKILAYPARKGNPRFPIFNSQAQDSVGVIREIRDYRAGDSPKRIHWRSLAKNKQLRTLVHDSESDRSCQFRWEDTSALDIESRLSQLSLWIDTAEKNNFDWKLQLPGQSFERHLKPEAFQQALTALAVWEKPS